jgi:hypothetical protein
MSMLFMNALGLGWLQGSGPLPLLVSRHGSPNHRAAAQPIRAVTSPLEHLRLQMEGEDPGG